MGSLVGAEGQGIANTFGAARQRYWYRKTRVLLTLLVQTGKGIASVLVQAGKDIAYTFGAARQARVLLRRRDKHRLANGSSLLHCASS